MRILLLAPHPFYQERGTPISVDLLIRALSERGDLVDVLTFHEGENRHYAGVRIHRIQPPCFGIRNIRPGPSIKKLICDLYLLAAFARRLRQEQYDIIHAVEESAFMAMGLKPFSSLPFIYDMDSSLATQLTDKYRLLRPFAGLLRFIESLPVRSAEVVMPMCEALAREIRHYGPRHVAVIKDVSLLDAGNAGSGPAPLPARGSVPAQAPLREALGIQGPITMYIGNLESYQGIDLLLESFALVHRQMADVSLIVIGGIPADIASYLQAAEKQGIADNVHFLGKRPVSDLHAYMRQADVLVSPRIKGLNTPMKIYSYLHSGVPVLATDLPTHTQVMDQSTARLAAPVALDFANGWLALLQNPSRGAELALRARALIEREHSYAAFRKALYKLYEHLELRLAPPIPSSQNQ